MPDLDRYLYDQLRAHAAGVDVPVGDVDAVMARGRHRRHRRAGASLLAVVAAAGTVTGVVVSNSSSGGSGQLSVGSPTSLPAAAGTQLSWRVVPARAGLSGVTSLSSSGEIAYAVSTAPGVVPAGNQLAAQLYRTADGLSWTTATGPTGLSTAGVAVEGNRVYTVGTGPAQAATGASGATTAAVSWTDNGGGTWQSSALPIDLPAPAGAVTVNDEALNVAAGPKGVVASVAINTSVDLSKLKSGVSAKTLWTANANGVEVLGPRFSSQCGFSVATAPNAFRHLPGAPLTPSQAAAAAAKLRTAYTRQIAGTGPKSGVGPPAVARSGNLSGLYDATAKAPMGQISSLVPCVGASGKVTRYVPADQAYRVVKTYSWSQLKIGSQLAIALQGEPLVFYSSDGTKFQQVSVPAGIALVNVTATPGGFAMLGSTADGSGMPVVLQSADGRNWTAARFGLPVGATQASVIGDVDNHLVVLGQTNAAAVAYTLTAGGWQTTTLPVGYQAVSFGAIGVALVGVSPSGDPGSWQVMFSRDGVHWSSASLVRLSGGSVDDANVLVGASQVVVTTTRQSSVKSGPQPQLQLVGTPAK